MLDVMICVCVILAEFVAFFAFWTLCVWSLLVFICFFLCRIFRKSLLTCASPFSLAACLTEGAASSEMVQAIGAHSFGADNRAVQPGCLHRISALRNRTSDIIGLPRRRTRVILQGFQFRFAGGVQVFVCRTLCTPIRPKGNCRPDAVVISQTSVKCHFGAPALADLFLENPRRCLLAFATHLHR